MKVDDSEHLLHLLVQNLRVILRKLGLLLCMVIEGTVMGFRMTMLWAIDVATLAWSLHKANLAVAFPALVGIGL